MYRYFCTFVTVKINKINMNLCAMFKTRNKADSLAQPSIKTGSSGEQWAWLCPKLKSLSTLINVY